MFLLSVSIIYDLDLEFERFTPMKTTPIKRLPDRHKSKRRPKYGQPK